MARSSCWWWLVGDVGEGGVGEVGVAMRGEVVVGRWIWIFAKLNQDPANQTVSQPGEQLARIESSSWYIFNCSNKAKINI